MIKLSLKIFASLIAIYLATFALLCLIEIKQISQLTYNTFKGTKDINTAINLAKEKNYVQAKIYADSAQAELSQSVENINRINLSALSLFPLVGEQLLEIKHLVTATELITRALSQGLDLADDFSQITSGNISSNYNSFSEAQKIELLQKFYTSAPELNGLKANFELALNELNQLNLHGVLWPAKYKILDVREQIAYGSQILNEVIPLSQIMPALAGHPAKSTFLVVLQNSDELRPTGGFIGTYGILETQSGNINRFDTHDIYHMDMPSQGKLKITPPEPIKLYLNDTWYMRDANWSPDWPTTAKQLEWFYNQENQFLTGANDINKFNGQFTGVIAINPRLVSSLLAIVGPITINNDEYSAENFTKVLELEVEQGYPESGISKWQRKEVVGQIVKELKIRLLNLPSKQWVDVLAALNTNLENKDFQFYFNDPGLNRIVLDNNWGGEINQKDNDFVMLVDSNFASLKTDSVISRELTHKIEPDANGLKATFSVTYKHSGPAKDWRTDRYKNYARLYVPEGSTLISYDGATVPVSITREMGKMAFGSLFYVELNSSKTVTISYYLPQKLVQKWNQGRYSLYWQKQPGSRVNKAQVDAVLPSRVKSHHPQSGIISPDEKSISWPIDLTGDQEISLNF